MIKNMKSCILNSSHVLLYKRFWINVLWLKECKNNVLRIKSRWNHANHDFIVWLKYGWFDHDLIVKNFYVNCKWDIDICLNYVRIVSKLTQFGYCHNVLCWFIYGLIIGLNWYIWLLVRALVKCIGWNTEYMNMYVFT